MEWIDPRRAPEPEERRALLAKDRSTPENRAFWDYVERTAKDVRGWPDWKRGGRAKAPAG